MKGGDEGGREGGIEGEKGGGEGMCDIVTGEIRAEEAREGGRVGKK